ncbi:MAG: GntR family transcriptional regulator [Lachnospiraceae bacterium]
MIRVQYQNTKPIYEQIKDSIRLLIRTGMIREKEKLPSVRDLAESLSLHPNTISRAYQELEEEGYLHKRTGSGTFCAARSEILEHQKKEQMLKFDETVQALLSLSLDAATLKRRIDELAGGTKNE